jgi:hypothetical protein
MEGLRHLRYLRRQALKKISNLHDVRLPALETRWLSRSDEEAEMSLINDYTYQAMTDQRERELAQLAESNWQIQEALNGRPSWWRRVLARRQQRIHTATERPAQRGMATPQHRVAH